MEVKVKPHLSAAPESSRSKPDSRSLRIIQYLTKSMPGSSSKEPNNTYSSHSSGEVGMSSTPNSDSEESDEELHAHVAHSSLSADTPRSLLRKLSNGLIKTESSYSEEEKPRTQAESSYTWGMSRSVLDVSKGVASDLKGSFGRVLEMKSMLIEKLAAMPTIPADSLEHARHSIESIISDATQSAYGKTKEAMVRIRLKLVEILPSLSPHETKMIVDDVERKVNGMSKASNADSDQSENAKDEGKDGRVDATASRASIAIAPRPTSGLVASVDRLKAWALLRSRL